MRASMVVLLITVSACAPAPRDAPSLPPLPPSSEGSMPPAIDAEIRRLMTVTKTAGLAVFAYAVMTLVDEGVLALDRPIAEYLSRPLPEYFD